MIYQTIREFLILTVNLKKKFLRKINFFVKFGKLWNFFYSFRTNKQTNTQIYNIPMCKCLGICVHVCIQLFKLEANSCVNLTWPSWKALEIRTHIEWVQLFHTSVSLFDPSASKLLNKYTWQFLRSLYLTSKIKSNTYTYSHIPTIIREIFLWSSTFSKSSMRLPLEREREREEDEERFHVVQLSSDSYSYLYAINDSVLSIRKF